MTITKTNAPKRINSAKVLSSRQQELFIKYFPVVKKIVNSMRGKLPSHADLDELHSAGVSGLADAVRRLDPDKRSSFDGYVAMRVRGAILDELRDLDYMSRSARSDAKHLEKIRDSLEQRYGRTPSDFEIRSGYPFLFACEPSEEGDEYIYTYGFEVNDMTEEEGKAAITEVLESLRSYE